jgi:uncharacterized protein (TIGR01777 family)
MAHFLITGGTGFIGRVLIRNLSEAGHQATVITRQPDKYTGQVGDHIKYESSFGAIDDNEVFHAVINLGGEGIGDKSWSENRKQVLFDSRIKLTKQLVACLKRLNTRPEVMISGSAIGWYGAQDEKPLTEDAQYHSEFTHDLCQQWEEAANEVKTLGIRLCIVRLGLVLGSTGGVLKRLLPPFKFGLGGRIGSGKQIMTWVHMDDLIQALNFLVNNNELEGVFNLTAPAAVSNAEFTRLLASALNRPAFFPLPSLVVKLLFGEMGDRLLLQGQNVVPNRLLEAKYGFDYPALEDALEQILHS